MKLCSLLLILLLSASAYGEIYSWRDKSGTTHYANSMDDVPGRYRARVKAMNYGPESVSDNSSPLTMPTTDTPPSAATHRPQAARGGAIAGQDGTSFMREKRDTRRGRKAAIEEE